jgi:oxygen-independent coproporphyrinogen-3 oxidase
MLRHESHAVSSAFAFDAEVLKRHDRPGPRYTSYPTAPQFTAEFDARLLGDFAARGNAAPLPRPLSLYLHIPFCFNPCFYCGCTRVITRDTARGTRYVERLLREAELVSPLFGREREVHQLHLGGGTPNFLSLPKLAWLMDGLGRHFVMSRSGARDFSIELDPRSIPEEYAANLARLGFNRVSFGVQDFNPQVQRAVNRVQSVEQTLHLIDTCRDNGIRSINVDLIYGLPRQTVSGFRQTLRLVGSARPDRVAVYAYAHLPGLFKAQRQIDANALPGPDERVELLRLAIEELGASGYRYIGMDHFALPDDELVRAQEAGGLHRNFMGYTTHANCDLVGIGVSAISHVGDSFSQNFRELRTWEAAVDSGRLPLWRGLALSADDRVRAAVIGQLMCQGAVEVATIEREFDIDFASYFRDSLALLQPHVSQGLVRLETARITATPAGRLLLRSLAMCFDAYLGEPTTRAAPPTFSRAV